MKKLTKTQFHFLYFAKGWYDDFPNSNEGILFFINKKIFGSGESFAYGNFFRNMIELVSEREKISIFEKLLDDEHKKESGIYNVPDTLEKRLHNHLVGKIIHLSINDVDMIIPLDELRSLREESKAAEDFYFKLEKAFDDARFEV